MLPFGTSTVEFALVTFVSAFVGVSLMIGASGLVKARYLAAFALGVYLWFFTDTLGGANYLDALNGPVFSWNLVALLVLFTAGVLVFFAADGRLFSAGEEGKTYGMLVAAIAALAVGLHGFGEGADFGYTAGKTSIGTLLGAFGGLQEGASWVLHKMMEPTVAAAVYVAFADPHARGPSEKLVDAATLAGVFVIPAVAGAAVGYYTSFDHTYFYALGLGASVFALTRVGKALYRPDGGGGRGLSAKVAVAATLGFLLIYLAALLHS